MKTTWFSKESLDSLLGLFSIYFHQLRDALTGLFNNILSLSFPGLKDEGCTGRKPSLSEDPSRSSTYERENKGVEFQISDSSINTPDQTLDSHGAGNTSNPSEFVNHGLLFWTQSREQWIGNKRKENRVQQVIEPRLSSNATHDSVLETNKPYVQPIASLSKALFSSTSIPVLAPIWLPNPDGSGILNQISLAGNGRLSFGHVGAGGDLGYMIRQKTCQMTLETGLLFARPTKSVVI
ncbi:hypothetical protein CKAN_00064700 [Cinnamomum micranthum f. kanehirae]|uniref:Gag1-like clamp domain-containing protein n=1 Tax=Cinnamomum micranthum f. kanehirae TaxID=337451 RepID=A0A443N1P5_9MAGN|nr:hypothetical protein CKAN_00064700 [Cinnamomum micranthum f. kanehirae]